LAKVVPQGCKKATAYNPYSDAKDAFFVLFGWPGLTDNQNAKLAHSKREKSVLIRNGLKDCAQQRLTKMAFLSVNFLHLIPLKKYVAPESEVFKTRHFR